jgi:hypothetical protein
VTRGPPSSAAAPFQNRRDLVDLPFEAHQLIEAFERVRTAGRFTLGQRTREAAHALGYGLMTLMAGGSTLPAGKKQSVLLFLLMGVPAGLGAFGAAWRAFSTPHTRASHAIDRVAWDRLSHELVCLSGETEVLVYGSQRVRLTSAPTENGRGHAVTLQLDGELMATVVFPAEDAERLVAALRRDGLL